MNEQQSIVDFYTELVLPGLAERLDTAFPEFGWQRDARGWIATNDEMTHRMLGVRANRVVAHGPAPRGFLIHGGEPTLWTAYVNGGSVPRGEEFVRVVKEIAQRSGADVGPIERAVPRDRRAELLDAFFDLAGRELLSERGTDARAYLDRRGFPIHAIETSGLGLVPSPDASRKVLSSRGFGDAEVAAAGILSDSRWPRRLCGAWRNEWGKIGTLWARSLDEGGAAETRYLYLRGASRTNLPPYGLSHSARELVLVEGFFDFHQLCARGVDDVAALGGTATSQQMFERLSRRGIQAVVLCLDNDDAGRSASARAVEHSTRARNSPAIYVVRHERFGATKDPDELVRRDGVEAWQTLVGDRECGVAWQAKEIVGDVAADAPLAERREALGRAGAWIGSLPPRLALEQEDAVRVVAEVCGYSAEAVARSFMARFWGEPSLDRALVRPRAMDAAPEL